MTAKRKSKSDNKKSKSVSPAEKSVKKVKNAYYFFKKAMKFCGILSVVFGIGFGSSFFTKSNSALSTFSYEMYDIVYEIFADFDNLEYGIPGRADTVINREGYAIGYSDKYKQPLWVCYNLTAEEVKSKKAKRDDNFRSDWRLWGDSAQLEDYKGSSYDRGHLAPAADMGWSTKVMSQSFFMSDMSPQDPSLNRGAWKKLEKKVRDMAVKCKKLHVISGPVFERADYKRIGNSRVAVPHGYYKILYAPEQNEMIGFILPNSDVNSNLTNYAVSVYDVEDAVQLEFLMKVAPEVRKKLKNKINKDFWKL